MPPRSGGNGIFDLPVHESLNWPNSGLYGRYLANCMIYSAGINLYHRFYILVFLKALKLLSRSCLATSSPLNWPYPFLKTKLATISLRKKTITWFVFPCGLSVLSNSLSLQKSRESFRSRVITCFILIPLLPKFHEEFWLLLLWWQNLAEQNYFRLCRW